MVLKGWDTGLQLLADGRPLRSSSPRCCWRADGFDLELWCSNQEVDAVVQKPALIFCEIGEASFLTWLVYPKWNVCCSQWVQYMLMALIQQKSYVFHFLSKEILEKHFKNGEVRISEIWSSRRTMRTLAEIVKINFFKLWKLIKELWQFEEHAFKRNGWNSVRTISFAVF